MSISPNKKWFEISNVTEQSADVYIYDFIGEFGVSAPAFLAQIQALKVPCLNVHVNSGGGSVFDGLAIYNGLVAHSAKVICYIDGIAASIASVICMAGDEIIMAENAFMMIHQVSTESNGNAGQMRTQAEFMDKLDASIVNIYAARTGGDPEVIAVMMGAETWLNAEDALDLCFCTSVSPCKTAATCAVDLSKFRNAPPALVDATASIEPTMSKQSKTAAPVAVVTPEVIVAAATVAPVAIATTPEVVAVVPPVEPVASVGDTIAVKTAVEAAHAAAKIAFDAAVADFTAKLTAKDAQISELTAKLAAAELLGADKLGVPPVAHIAAAPVAPVAKKSILETYRSLAGKERTAFFAVNKDAIWAAYDVENSTP